MLEDLPAEILCPILRFTLTDIPSGFILADDPIPALKLKTANARAVPYSLCLNKSESVALRVSLANRTPPLLT